MAKTAVRKKILNSLGLDQNWKYYKKINDFDIYLLESCLGNNIYKIENIFNFNAKYCIKLFSDPKIRELISNGSITCKLLYKDNTTKWYEKIIYNSKSETTLFSIEKLILNLDHNILFSYSEDPPDMLIKNNLNQRDNLLSFVKFKEINKQKCKLEAYLTFGEFELIQEDIINASINHFETFKKTL